MKSTSSEKDYLKEAQDNIRKYMYKLTEKGGEYLPDIEAGSRCLLNIAQYNKINKELSEDE